MEYIAIDIASGVKVDDYSLTLKWIDGSVHWSIIDDKTGMVADKGVMTARRWANLVYSTSWKV
jgi:hypothetical protein